MAKFKVCVYTITMCNSGMRSLGHWVRVYDVSPFFFVCLKNKEAVAKLVLV